jgi:hypothetical protein
VEAVREDLVAPGEAVVGEDPVMLGEVAIAKALRWTRGNGYVRHGPGGG